MENMRSQENIKNLERSVMKLNYSNLSYEIRNMDGEYNMDCLDKSVELYETI